MQHVIEPIGYIRSPYKEKFAIPRQSNLVPAARTELVLVPPYNAREIVDSLDTFSHVWLIFGFHENFDAKWHNKIRPPRLGGNKKVGVLASRSTFRPNGLGLSVLKLIDIKIAAGTVYLTFQGGDLLDGTPVFDIKPYLSYVDTISDAQSGYAPSAPNDFLTIYWSKTACAQLTHEPNDEERVLIEQVLQQDPRPSYRKGHMDDHDYGVKLIRFNIRFRIEGSQCLITQLTAL